MKGIDLANYIVSKQIKKGEPTNTLSLQKVIYFVNAEFIKSMQKPELLIEDDLEKWKFGPVVRDVYKEYSLYGQLPITDLPASQLFYWDEEEFLSDLSKKNISQEELNKWIDKYIDVPRFDLVNWTHKHKAWKNYEEEIMEGIYNLTYTGDELYQEISDSSNNFFRFGE